MKPIALFPLLVLLSPVWLWASPNSATSGHVPLLENHATDVNAENLAQVDLTRDVAASSSSVDAEPVPRYTTLTIRGHGSGHTTRELLRLQASGESAAPMLPMLGQASSAAYKRYLDSFSHSIPEFFDTTVEGPGRGK